jgi:methylenetetrahydrofolate--tRNA-(uracil-5-)-methyltransferase
MTKIKIIGAGLAGCEAAYQLAKRGFSVELWEMKPQKFSPAHHYEGFGELVCSNSLRSDSLTNAVGLLKEEMRQLDSLILRAADATRVPAGGSLAVDRYGFSDFITKEIRNTSNIEVINGEVSELSEEEATIVATGPLTSEPLTEMIGKLVGGQSLSFFDAAAPIVTKESINFEIAFCASRYNKGEADYINCPMNREQYEAFYQALVEAERAPLHGFEDSKVFEGCMPVEVMARRGEMTLAFGPMKPVGIYNPATGRDGYYAVVQLRQDNKEGTLYNLVGFQTNLKFGEQKRVFSMIPGLEHAEFVRYGVMHRNTYINSTKLLNQAYQMREHSNLFFAGQITGVEGYIESAGSGLLAGIQMAQKLRGREFIDFTRQTVLGAMASYISDRTVGDFQPMNANFGLIEPLSKRIRNKKERYGLVAERSLQKIEQIKKQIDSEEV